MKNPDQVRLARIALSIHEYWYKRELSAEERLKQAGWLSKDAKFAKDEIAYIKERRHQLMRFERYWQLKREAENSHYRPAPTNSEILDLVQDGGNGAWNFMTSPFTPCLTFIEAEDFRSDLLPIGILAGSLFGEYELSEWDICTQYSVVIAQSAMEPSKFCIYGMETERTIDNHDLDTFFSNAEKAVNEEKRRAIQTPNGTYSRFDGSSGRFVNEAARNALARINFSTVEKTYFSRLGFSNSARERLSSNGVTAVDLRDFIDIYDGQYPYKQT